jgi:hypothetical protein
MKAGHGERKAGTSAVEGYRLSRRVQVKEGKYERCNPKRWRASCEFWTRITARTVHQGTRHITWDPRIVSKILIPSMHYLKRKNISLQGMHGTVLSVCLSDLSHAHMGNQPYGHTTYTNRDDLLAWPQPPAEFIK